MRRKDREILDVVEIEKAINESDVVRVGFAVGDTPYIVPMNFGYDQGAFYFHCAKNGRKIDMMRSNPNVCFELEAKKELITGDRPCDWSMKYVSVMGSGKLSIIESDEEKRRAMDLIMVHYGATGPFHYDEKHMNAVYLLKLVIGEWSCKKANYLE